MPIPLIHSVKTIEKRYSTGEKPVLVVCSDKKSYICKYIQFSAAAYKLICELIGSQMAKAWKINTPDTAFVQIYSQHWLSAMQLPNSMLAFGSCILPSVVDITPSTYLQIVPEKKQLYQLLKIALFDFWIANEDRNINNANMLYDVENLDIISIDYGCIFNTATFDFPLSQLTTTDTILFSGIFSHLIRNTSEKDLWEKVNVLEKEFQVYIKESRRQVKFIKDAIPDMWNIDTLMVDNKMSELFEPRWLEDIWRNFVECIKDNIKNG